MISRRAMLNGGVFGAVSVDGGMTGEQAAPADPRQVRELIGEVREIGEELRLANTASFTGTSLYAEKLREAMLVFLRANNKYPDYLDVGIQVFHAMYDWHVHNRLPLAVGRSADGRYGLVFMFTRLMLRPDAVPDFIGIAYDQRG